MTHCMYIEFISILHSILIYHASRYLTFLLGQQVMYIATDKCHQPNFLACSLIFVQKLRNSYSQKVHSQQEGRREDECDTLTGVFLTTIVLQCLYQLTSIVDHSSYKTTLGKHFPKVCMWIEFMSRNNMSGFFPEGC